MRVAELVFHCRGAPAGDFHKAWAAACVEAGLYQVVGVNANGSEKRIPSRLFHDLRRSGIRNMVRAGVREAMQRTSDYISALAAPRDFRRTSPPARSLSLTSDLSGRF